MGFKVHVFYKFILEEYIMHVDSENKEVKSNFSAETVGRFEPARFWTHIPYMKYGMGMDPLFYQEWITNEPKILGPSCSKGG